MNNSYYGVTRSDTYLEHYGVKGMKWGVRKAKESGNLYRLGKHYAKAEKKLKRLTEQAETGRGIAAKRVAKGGLASAALSGVGTYALNRMQGASRAQAAMTAGIAAGVGGAGGALLNAGRATQREKTATRFRRNEWKREMDSTFKGTRYAKRASDARKNLKNRLGPDSPRFGYDKAADVNYIDLRTKKQRAKQHDAQLLEKYKTGAKKGTGAAGFIAGSAGAGIQTARNLSKMKRSNPKDYERFKKAYKNMSFSQRMRYNYS